MCDSTTAERFPGLSEDLRKFLGENLHDWGRGVDPDRDFWDAKEEYPDLSVSDGTLSATVPEAVIRFGGRRYNFGRFVIHIGFQDTLIGSYYPWADALDPKPGGEEEHVHPHVDSYVCLGEVYPMYKAACLQGRWGDALSMVHRVLCSYGESPFTDIDEWEPDEEE